jgi:hypothetical protein
MKAPDYIQERLDKLSTDIQAYLQEKGVEIDGIRIAYMEENHPTKMTTSTDIVYDHVNIGNAIMKGSFDKNNNNKFVPYEDPYIQHITEVVLNIGPRWALRTCGRLRLLEKAFEEMMWTLTDRTNKMRQTGSNEPPCSAMCMMYHDKGGLMSLVQRYPIDL